MILRKVVEYYVFFICAKSRHCSWKSTRDIFVYVCFSVFVHVNCATDQGNHWVPVYALISERWCFWLNGSFTFRRDQGISLESISIFSNAKVVRHSCRSQEVCALSTHHGFLNLSLFSLQLYSSLNTSSVE